MRSGLEKLAAKFTAPCWKPPHFSLFSFLRSTPLALFFKFSPRLSASALFSDCNNSKGRVAPFEGLPERLIVLKMVYEEVGYCLSPS